MISILRLREMCIRDSLKSNVNLHLNQGTTLIASENSDLYPEMRSRVAGIEMVWPSAVINILDAENAAISGAGTVSYTHLDVYKRQPLDRSPAFPG